MNAKTQNYTVDSNCRDYLLFFSNDFESKYGQKIRVLHIGNIANNAYINAKMMNEVGFDCDVLCNDYYHGYGDARVGRCHI